MYSPHLTDNQVRFAMLTIELENVLFASQKSAHHILQKHYLTFYIYALLVHIYRHALKSKVSVI